MFYSPTTGGFYDRKIHGDAIPADAVEITCDEHAALLAGQSAGQRIEADEHGRPVLRDAPAPDNDALADAARARRDALSHGPPRPRPRRSPDRSRVPAGVGHHLLRKLNRS